MRRLKQAQRLVRNAHRDNEDNRVQLWDLELGLIGDKLVAAICAYSQAVRKAVDKLNQTETKG